MSKLKSQLSCLSELLPSKREEREPAVLSFDDNVVDEGAVYHGEWLDEVTRQGKGTLTRTNGEKYEGFFFKNKFDGKGIL